MDEEGIKQLQAEIEGLSQEMMELYFSDNFDHNVYDDLQAEREILLSELEDLTGEIIEIE